jgi:DnaJ like chaperone protein
VKQLIDRNQTWAGKAVGATLGFMFGGPFGLVIGAITGHLFDRVAAKAKAAPRGDLQQEHISALFRIMGHLAKADGRVSEDEISAAGKVMNGLNLIGERRQMAVRLFSEGKLNSYRLVPEVQRLERSLPESQQEGFVELLLQVAYADGGLNKDEKAVIKTLTSAFGIAPLRFIWLCNRVKSERGWQGRERKSSGPEMGATTSKMSTEVRRAYVTLGLTTDVTDDILKRTFRRLMSEYHPDKLSASGASDAQVNRAKEKAQEVQMAYSIIKKHRKGAR